MNFVRSSRLRHTKAQRPLALLVLLTTAAIGSCRSGDGSRLVGPEVEFRASYQDCVLPGNGCATVEAAIVALETSGIGICEARGNVARLRFEAAGYGFRAGDPTISAYAYVLMENNPSYPSGDGPTDYNTYVNPAYFGLTPAQRAGVLAHEEEHQSGADNRVHSTGVATATETTCTIS